MFATSRHWSAPATPSAGCVRHPRREDDPMIEKLPERGLPPMQPGELSARRFCRRSIGPRRRSAQDGDRPKTEIGPRRRSAQDGDRPKTEIGPRRRSPRCSVSRVGRFTASSKKRKYRELRARPEEAAKVRLADLRRHEREGTPSGRALRPKQSAGDQDAACARSPRPIGPYAA
jgi:hypothetical protein